MRRLRVFSLHLLRSRLKMSRRRWIKGGINLSFSWFYQLQPSKPHALCPGSNPEDLCVLMYCLLRALLKNLCEGCSASPALEKANSPLPFKVSAAPRALLALKPGCQHRGSNRASRCSSTLGTDFYLCLNQHLCDVHQQWRRGGKAS